MTPPLLGVHHITAIARDPQRNIDFYAGFLGLRLVKRTVNFDAPEVHHLYYGDGYGRPGTIITFFPFPDAVSGRRGTGQATSVAFSVSPRSLGFWIDRLAAHAISFDGPLERFREAAVSFVDPDGLLIELVATGDADVREGWEGGSVPPEHALRGIFGATLGVAEPDQSAEFLTSMLGFTHAGEGWNRMRFVAGSGSDMARIDILTPAEETNGRIAVGSVHHIAWRVPDRQAQEAWRDVLARKGERVTPIIDRQYFTSIYFNEPGGILYEIAADPPGFGVDEEPEHLGSTLKLPPWLESQRQTLEALLPQVSLPDIRRGSLSMPQETPAQKSS